MSMSVACSDAMNITHLLPPPLSLNEQWATAGAARQPTSNGTEGPKKAAQRGEKILRTAAVVQSRRATMAAVMMTVGVT